MRVCACVCNVLSSLNWDLFIFFHFACFCSEVTAYSGFWVVVVLFFLARFHERAWLCLTFIHPR